MTTEFDIVIVGGGLVGATLACALGRSKYKVAIVDDHDVNCLRDPGYDDRSTTLTLNSKNIYAAIGVWHKIAPSAAPIQQIHISNQGSFGTTRLVSNRYGLPAFGYVVSNFNLYRSLLDEIASSQNIRIFSSTQVKKVQQDDTVCHIELMGVHKQVLTCLLMVAADGSQSFVRTQLDVKAAMKEYNQVAIVGRVTFQRPHDYTAFERFTPHGPLAILPLHDARCGFVWTHAEKDAGAILQLSDDEFMRQLQKAFGYRLGKIQKIGKRAAYPLVLLVSETLVKQRTVFVGNAAQTLHPVAGQGFNLALRDLSDLVGLLSSNDFDLKNVQSILVNYEQLRAQDSKEMISFTDRLNWLFSNTNLVLQQTRGLGLLAFSKLPLLQRKLINRSTKKGYHSSTVLKGMHSNVS